MNVLIVAETIILVVLCVLVAGLLRSYATVLQRLHHLDGAEVGAASAAPPFRTTDGVIAPAGQRVQRSGSAPAEDWPLARDIVGQGLSGEIVSIRTVQVPRDTTLVFLSSGCSGCGGFWEQLSDPRVFTPSGTARVLVVTKNAEEESISLLRELAPTGVDLIMSSAAWADYAVPGSPYVIVVDGPSGRVKGEGSGTSLTQVSGLMKQAFGDSMAAPAGSVDKPRGDTEREVDVDRRLLAAGIGPGHQSLYVTGAAVPEGIPAHHRLDLVEAVPGRMDPEPGGRR